ncbi:MAG: hypothetical protein K2N82_10995 [Lachnospiraceae bacterium]|nr:hypothetical protein [Lachnospiraceae bacterium]
MSDIRLPKHFFEENPLSDISTALLTHFRMLTITMPVLNEQINEMVIPNMEKSRYDQCMAEKECIMNLKNAEDIVSYMRKIKDPSNSSFLIQKAIEYQADVIPLVLKRICRSGHDVFIENTAILIANADIKYTEELYAVFPDIRNTYARSELCIVFGVKKKAEYTQLLMEQFKKIKEERPDEDYEQGPLLALHLIYEQDDIHA